jgi:hypothetical protein
MIGGEYHQNTLYMCENGIMKWEEKKWVMKEQRKR